MNNLREAIRQGFLFLVNEYDFRLVETTEDTFFYKLVFKNKTTGVVVLYENRDQVIEVLLYRLRNGEIIKNITRALRSNEKMNAFNLNFIVQFKNPSDIPLPIHEYPDNSDMFKDGYSKYVNLYVRNLKKYADEILRGDFSSFIELEEQFRDMHSKR